jgi:hypothetical protein
MNLQWKITATLGPLSNRFFRLVKIYIDGYDFLFSNPKEENMTSTIPLAKFHGHFLNTFSQLPLENKILEVVKRVIVAVVAPFAYLLLGFIAIVGYPCTRTVSNTKIDTKNNSPKPPAVPERVFSSGVVKNLHADLDKAKDYQRRDIYFKIANEEIKQKNNAAASLALDEITKILDASEHQFATSYCKVAEMRIMLKPNTEPYELKKAAELKEASNSKHGTPSFCLGDDIIAIAQCYHLLNNEEMVRNEIKSLFELADRFKGRKPYAYIGTLVSCAQFQIKIKQIEDALPTINDIIIPAARETDWSLDGQTPVEWWANLATVLIEYGHINEPVPGLIKLAEKGLLPLRNLTSQDVENLRKQIKDAKQKIGNGS